MLNYNSNQTVLKSYLLFTLANSCMPCLYKVKPANLITFSKKHISDRTYFFALLTQELNKYHCAFKILHETISSFFILIYTPSLLENVLYENKNHSLFRKNGYSNTYNLDGNLSRLMRRYQRSNLRIGEFPHEIGIFLGYPLYDVEAYIYYKGENFILAGYWKVYHNAENACDTFRLYKELKEQAIVEYYKGSYTNFIDIKNIK